MPAKKSKKTSRSILPLLSEKWKKMIVESLPWLAVGELIYLFLQLKAPLALTDTFEEFKYLPFVGGMTLLFLTPLFVIAWLVFILFTSQGKPIPPLSIPKQLLTLLPILMGFLVIYLLFKRKRIAWYLLLFASIFLALTNFKDIVAFAASVVAVYVIIQVKEYYKN